MSTKSHAPGFLKLVEEAKKQIHEISVEKVLSKKQREHPFHLIDVREESEWKQGHAQDAIHLSRGILERDIESRVPNKSDEIIMYCGGGYRSALAAQSLKVMGYTNVYSVTGGWRAWQEAKAPIKK